MIRFLGWAWLQSLKAQSVSIKCCLASFICAFIAIQSKVQCGRACILRALSWRTFSSWAAVSPPPSAITANKSRGTTNIAILAMTIIIFRSFSNSVISDAVGEDIFVLEVLFERNAARHDGEELRITAWVRGKVLFRQFFFAIQPMPAAKTVRVPAFTIVLTSLLSKMV